MSCDQRTELAPTHQLGNVCLQWDDPLDAIAVHAWNGTWGVLAVGFLAGKGLIRASYGFASTDPNCVVDNSTNSPSCYRQWGCWVGGDGHLLGAQIIYMLWLAGVDWGLHAS